MEKTKKRSPWAWIPTLYFAQGIPYVAVNVITVIMYKRMGLSNTDIALYTSWLYLPWVIKPFWSPFVDIIKTKRWWTVLMQWLLAFGLAGIAFAIPTPFYFSLTLSIFWLIGFVSATHDIASDGFYMLALSEHDQSKYVGIRSTFYRVATIMGQGVLVVVAGLIESNTGLDPIYLDLNVKPEAKVEMLSELPTINNVTSTGDVNFVFDIPKEVGTIAPDSVTGGGTTLPFADYKKTLIKKAQDSNVANGFAPKEEEIKQENIDDEKGWWSEFWSKVKKWIKDTFGEERESKDVINNFAIIAVTMNQAPKDESMVLITEYDKGDQSNKIVGNSRLEFTKDNWNKTAYVIVDVDAKIKEDTITSYKSTSGNIPFAWLTVFAVLSIFFFIVAFYHNFALPKPDSDRLKNADPEKKNSAKTIILEFIETFKTFFQKKQVWVAVLFMLLYRLPEAQMIKIINPFLLDPMDKGGLGLTTGQVGIVFGTIGIIGLTIGGIIGGLCAAKGGLKKWLWPMALSTSLNCLAYIFLSNIQPDSSTTLGNITIYCFVFLEQFGYGFGFTAFMLFMMYFADGEHKTSHYAICTAFMALGMMIPGMFAGAVEELLGYRHFFYWVLICNIATWVVTALIKVDPNYGKKKE